MSHHLFDCFLGIVMGWCLADIARWVEQRR
jgi:hypothetical protein